MDKEVERILENHEKRIRKLEETSETRPPQTEKWDSLRELMSSKRPAGDIQKTLVVGYYLEKDEGLSSFNSRNLEDAFRKAREPVPINLNDAANRNVKKGLMMESEEKKDGLKAWNLTTSGERAVENGFAGE